MSRAFCDEGGLVEEVFAALDHPDNIVERRITFEVMSVLHLEICAAEQAPLPGLIARC